MKKEEKKEFNFTDYVKPLRNGMILQAIKDYKVGEVTETGIVIAPAGPSHTPEADVDIDPNKGDKLGLRVVAVGSMVTDIKEGDLIMLLPNSSYVGFDIFGETYFYSPDYNLMAIISEDADRINIEMKKEKEKMAQEIFEFKRSKYYTNDIPKDNKLDIK